MSQYIGQTRTTYASVENIEEAKEILAAARRFCPHLNFDTLWDGDEVAIYSDPRGMGPMSIPDDPEEFLSRLGELLEEPMAIVNVGHEGARHLPDAYQWTVNPDGTVESARLGRHLIGEE